MAAELRENTISIILLSWKSRWNYGKFNFTSKELFKNSDFYKILCYFKIPYGILTIFHFIESVFEQESSGIELIEVTDNRFLTVFANENHHYRSANGSKITKKVSVLWQPSAVNLFEPQTSVLWMFLRMRIVITDLQTGPKLLRK